MGGCGEAPALITVMFPDWLKWISKGSQTTLSQLVARDGGPPAQLCPTFLSPRRTEIHHEGTTRGVALSL